MEAEREGVCDWSSEAWRESPSCGLARRQPTSRPAPALLRSASSSISLFAMTIFRFDCVTFSCTSRSACVLNVCARSPDCAASQLPVASTYEHATHHLTQAPDDHVQRLAQVVLLPVRVHPARIVQLVLDLEKDRVRRALLLRGVERIPLAAAAAACC